MVLHEGSASLSVYLHQPSTVLELLASPLKNRHAITRLITDVGFIIKAFDSVSHE